ncbi:hypothetical protein BR93DRAFT_584379 [Coniochaeta sp. PMI_546]|nr:hypothetical protein BR93DRAFT_584379 [Coniochaeta sp. PMI_546]
MAPHEGDTPPSPSQLPPVPASPTFTYASTTNPLSSYNLPLPPPPRPPHAVLTKTDLDNSTTAYTSLLSTAKSYRQALATLSTAASSFGSALESCARLKEARADILSPSSTTSSSAPGAAGTTSDPLLAAAGLQHLIANHHQILSETLYRSFEVPLLHELDKWRAAVSDEEEGYQTAIRAQSREIRRLEKEGLKLHRQRRPRDVARFREHLVELTAKLDGLTAIHGEHARTLLRESQETSLRIVDASCSLVRAEIDIFESLARKGWTGGGLEDVLEKGVDLFAAEDGGAGAGAVGEGGEPGEEGGLFSILPPKSILADSASENNTVSTVRAVGGAHGRSDSLMDYPGDLRYQSMAGAVSDRGPVAAGPGDGDSVFSEFNRPRGGGPRPFSPQPMPLRINPDGLITGSYEEPTLLGGQQDGVVIPARDEDEQPWRDEGLASETESETREQGAQSQRPSLSSQGSRRLERRWSVTEDVESP